MKITIKTTKLKISPAIKKTIEEKIAPLDRFIARINVPLEASVEVARETRHHQKGKIYYAEVNIKVPGRVIRAEAREEDVHKAINAAKEELQVLLKKYKQKQIAKRKRAARIVKRKY